MRDHNTLWQEKWRRWLLYAEAGSTSSWPSPELRMRLEGYLPWDDFVHSLGGLGRAFLPGPEWLPAVLAQDQPHLQRRSCGGVAGLPGFWRLLPDSLSRKVCFAADELAALFCQLADPLRNGTAGGRYPQQQQRWLEILHGRPAVDRPPVLLDLGCGVGLGTCALLQLLRGQRGEAAEADGVSAERLEVWMASSERLPHAPGREREYAELAGPRRPRYYHGSAETCLMPRRYDDIFCNGLIGGAWLRHRDQYRAVLRQFERYLQAGGTVFLANRFHAGCRRDVEAFMQMAAGHGWEVQGEWNDAVLHHLR